MQRQRQRHSEESEAWALSETIEDRGANVPTAVHFLELYQTGNGSQEGHCYLAQWHGLQENPLSIVPPRQNNLQLSRHLHPRRQKRIRAVTCSLIRSERRRCKHLFMRLAVLIQPYCPWISPAVEKRRDLQKSLGGHSEAGKQEKEKELNREEKKVWQGHGQGGVWQRQGQRIWPSRTSSSRASCLAYATQCSRSIQI